MTDLNFFTEFSSLIPKKKHNYIIKISCLNYCSSFLIAFILVHLYPALSKIAKVMLLKR